MDSAFFRRLRQANQIQIDNPKCVPVICKYKEGSLIFKDLSTDRIFITNKEETILTFLIKLRKSITIPSDISIFILLNNDMMPATTSLIGDLYYKYKSDDNFLYFNLLEENCFG